MQPPALLTRDCTGNPTVILTGDPLTQTPKHASQAILVRAALQLNGLHPRRRSGYALPASGMDKPKLMIYDRQQIQTNSLPGSKSGGTVS